VPILFQDGKHEVERPTILYMPHCDLKLYENIIGANWSEEQLARIIFVANRFKDYTDKYVCGLSFERLSFMDPYRSYPQSKLEVESPFLMRLGGIDHHNNKYWLISRSMDQYRTSSVILFPR
jgi:hypothetical protein